MFRSTLLFLAAITLFSAFSGCSGGGPLTKIDYPNLPSIEQQGGTVGTLNQSGVKIRYASFPTTSGAVPVGTAVVTTGRTQFIEAYLEVIAEFQKRGYTVWAMDWRGQGLSDRLIPEEPSKGYVASFDDYVKDMEYFTKNVIQWNGDKKVLFGQSMGGGLAVYYATSHAGAFTHVVAGSPLIDLAAPGFLKGIVSFAASMNPKGYVLGEGGDYGNHSRTFAGNVITHDENRFKRLHAFIDREPRLALGAPTNLWIKSSLMLPEHFTDAAFMSKLNTPVLIFSAETDKLVSVEAQRVLADKYPKMIRRVDLPGTFHEIFLETDGTQQKIWAEIDSFLK